MTLNQPVRVRRRREPLSDSMLLMLVAIGFFIVIYGLSMLFLGTGFRRPARFIDDILNQNSYLIIIACGLSVVMITGSIDISVGGVVGCVSMFCAVFLSNGIFPAADMAPEVRIVLAALFAIIIGLAFGMIQGAMIAYLDIQPFIVTLAGMFFSRGLTTMISKENVSLSKYAPEVNDLLSNRFSLWFGEMEEKGLGKKKALYPVMTHAEYFIIVAIVIVVIVAIMLHKTKLGRNFYAVGGNRQSALMLGVNVRKTRFLAHVISGVLAGIGGFVYLWNTKAGNIFGATQAEMQAIASSIIGGTLLTGGVGNVIGTFFGVLILATIRLIVPDVGNLPGMDWLKKPYWQDIFNGIVLCLFIVMQSILLKVRGVLAGKRSEREQVITA
ncbi:MAG: sugar ABC transporter permease YjfF [Clostridia bacterium]|nr:sugar ABC transporter permease YjfF [Clostridia bacterium]